VNAEACSGQSGDGQRQSRRYQEPQRERYGCRDFSCAIAAYPDDYNVAARQYGTNRALFVVKEEGGNRLVISARSARKVQLPAAVTAQQQCGLFI